MTTGSPNMRSFAKDRTVADHKLTRDTLRRILQFARPYKGKLAVFVGLIALEAAAGAVTPLLFKHLIDDGITAGNTRVVLVIAAVVAVLAIISAGLSVADRWVSSQVGEGLILDLRTAVFDHVQRMPLAFFSRAKTGALVQRLNGDVLGAQQAFTSTLPNVVSNSLTIVFVLAAMLSMSWQLTLLSLVLLPAFVLPGALVRQEDRGDHPGELRAQRRRRADHERAVQRRRRPPGQDLRRPGARVPQLRRARSAASGTSASRAPCTPRGSASG